MAVVVGLSSIGIVSAQDEATLITLNGDSAEVAGTGAAVEGSIITISEAGTYTLSGTLNDGQVLVNAPEDAEVSLILNGVTISSSTSAPIYAQSAAAVTVILAEGSENSLSDAATYVYASAEEDEPDAALFSNVDLTIEGSGSLTVTANYADGISTDDDLIISGSPVITVNAVDDAIRGNDSIDISGGVFALNSTEGDGLKSSNEEASLILINGGSYVINAGDDGVQSDFDFTMNAGELVITAVGDGIHSEYNLTINDGSINILNSEEGIEGGFIVINDGEIHIVSTDDGINVSEPDNATTTTETTVETTTEIAAAVPAEGQQGGFGNQPPGGMMGLGQGGMMGQPGQGGMMQGGFGTTSTSPYYLHINGGYIVVNAEGDGLDANGSIEMTGGVVLVNGPTAFDNGAIDYDGTFEISGGLLVATGSAGMAQAPSTSSSQFSLLINYATAMDANTLVHIQTSEGEEVLTFAPAKTFQSVVFSSPDLAQGVTYDIYYGGTSDGTATDGLYADGTYTPGDLFSSVTITDTVTGVGQMGGMR